MDTKIADIITKDVTDQLKWDDNVDDSHISLKVSENHVFLEGHVNSYAAKISAAKDAYLVPGVKHVENNLEVHLTDETSLPDDDQITQNVTESLHLNNRIDSTGVEVETKNRVVTLTGTVVSFGEKFETENMANNTQGITGVINQLGVKPENTVEDKNVENDIRNAFERSILIDEDKIEIQVRRGVARLSGSVVNYAIKREAMDLVNYTSGVINIEDEITIE